MSWVVDCAEGDKWKGVGGFNLVSKGVLWLFKREIYKIEALVIPV